MARDRLLIDTTILIDHLRKPQKDKTLFYRLSLRFDYVIAVVTEFEFAIGSSPKNHDFVTALLTQIPVLALDSACIRTSVETYQHLKASNQLIPLPDIFIAATAITHDLPLLTLNQKHFARIARLRLYQDGSE